MLKLVSEVGNRWSFINGYQIYGNVVWLSKKEDIRKYSLINEKGEKIDINPENCLVNDEFYP